MEPDDGTRLNPWFSMWTQPRRTMRQILATDPQRNVVLLFAISGVSWRLDLASSKAMADRIPLPLILVGSVVGGAIVGNLLMSLYAFLLRWTGRWLRGSASAVAVRAAVAWPNVITAWGLLLWVPQLLLFGDELFAGEAPRFDGDLGLDLLRLGFFLLEGVVAFWLFVASVKTLSEVQGFSVWRALGNTAVAAIFFLAPFAALTIVYRVVSS